MNIYRTCTCCSQTKPLSDFHKSKAHSSGHVSQCKNCVNAKRKKYYENNREEENIKCWIRANPGIDISQRKQKSQIKLPSGSWQKANRESYREYQRKYRVERRIKDPLFRLTERLRKSVSRILKNDGFSKQSKTAEIVGCSYEEFYAHIESLFVDGMSWDNMDLWEIDHNIPVSWATTEQEVLALNHYTNLQPLWREDNLIKLDKYAGNNKTIIEMHAKMDLRSKKTNK